MKNKSLHCRTELVESLCFDLRSVYGGAYRITREETIHSPNNYHTVSSEVFGVFLLASGFLKPHFFPDISRIIADLSSLGAEMCLRSTFLFWDTFWNDFFAPRWGDFKLTSNFIASSAEAWQQSTGRKKSVSAEWIVGFKLKNGAVWLQLRSCKCLIWFLCSRTANSLLLSVLAIFYFLLECY